jgi:serine/threonine protein kinase
VRCSQAKRVRCSQAKKIGRFEVLREHPRHERGIVHRDVKPGDVIPEAETARVVLVDLGLVARQRLQAAWGSQDQATLTEDGTVLETPGLMAPEQGGPENGDPRAT